MPQLDAPRARAVEAVRTRMAERGLSPTGAAKEAGLADATVLDFMRGEKWPRAKSLAQLDAVLGWPSGTISRMADGAPAPVERDLRSPSGHVQLPLMLDDFADLSGPELTELGMVAAAVYMERARAIRESRLDSKRHYVSGSYTVPDNTPDPSL